MSHTQVEHMLVASLRRLTGIDEELARLILPNRNIEELVNLYSTLVVRRDGAGAKAKCKEIGNWVRNSTGVRNVIAHQLPAWRKGWVRYHPYVTAKVLSGTLQNYAVHLGQLDSLTHFNELLARAITEGQVSGLATHYVAAQNFVAMHDLPTKPD